MAQTEPENYEVTSVPSKDNNYGAACSMWLSHKPQYVVPGHLNALQYGSMDIVDIVDNMDVVDRRRDGQQ